MENDAKNLAHAIAAVPPGPWAVGVSGGADSVALLTLLRERLDLQLHVVHLDHETRAGASAEDATFVKQLAESWSLPVTIKKGSEVQRRTNVRNPANRYRRARFVLFNRTVREFGLQGVILAHHRDDQAETMFHMLIHGCSPIGLRGIQPVSTVGGTTVLHPLLNIPRDVLRAVLRQRNIEWREDATNAMPINTRNRARRLLAEAPDVTEALLDLCNASRTLCAALDAAVPRLEKRFLVQTLRGFPAPLARHALRRWLYDNSCDPTGINTDTLNRLLTMVEDSASPARQSFPGYIFVRRRSGEIFVDPSPPRT